MRRSVLVLAVILAVGKTAHSDVAPRVSLEDEEDSFTVTLDSSYLWDGGAVPFVYGSLAVALGVRFFVEPPDEPRLFSPSEGGRDDLGDTVPSAFLGAYSAGAAGLIAGVPNAARWHHLKGYGQAVLTTIALTAIAKNTVGRHRPHFREDDPDPDLRRSFFSGHASITASSTVYLGLYLSDHILPKFQESSGKYARAVTWTLLGGLLVGVPMSRVGDNRHHVSDVLTGSVVGGAMAVAFYAYQETRFQDERETFFRAKRSQLVLLPDIRNRGLSLLTRW